MSYHTLLNKKLCYLFFSFNIPCTLCQLSVKISVKHQNLWWKCFMGASTFQGIVKVRMRHGHTHIFIGEQQWVVCVGGESRAEHHAITLGKVGVLIGVHGCTAPTQHFSSSDTDPLCSALCKTRHSPCHAETPSSSEPKPWHIPCSRLASWKDFVKTDVWSK